MIIKRNVMTLYVPIFEHLVGFYLKQVKKYLLTTNMS